MPDRIEIEWPREIFAEQPEYTGAKVGSYYLSENAKETCAKGEATHQYIDADIYRSAYRYWEERHKAQTQHLEALRDLLARNLVFDTGSAEEALEALGGYAAMVARVEAHKTRQAGLTPIPVDDSEGGETDSKDAGATHG